MPINLDTINQLYGLNLTSFQVEEFFASVAEKRDVIKTSEDVVVSKVGRELYEKFFRGYTRKQWALDPSELDAQVTARVPTRTNRDNRYFTDSYQSMPLYGFTRMFENMLDHKNIKIMLNTDYRDVKEFIPFKEMIYTGPIDEYFDYQFGKLPYRCIEFKHETHDRTLFQPAAVVNYPNDYAYTRITEFKYLTGSGAQQNQRGVRVPAGRGRSLLSHSPGGKQRPLQALSGIGRDHAGRAFRRSSRLVSLLQHGSGGGSGVDAVQEDQRRAQGNRSQR